MSATDGRREIRRALVSVYDKTGLEELVRGLADAGVELVSTGGSARLIADLGLPVTRVEELTGQPVPDLLLPNRGDDDFVKIRLDEASTATALRAVARLAEPMDRALV